MAENTEARALLDTKFGTVDSASIVEKTGKGDKTYLTATMTTVSGKEITVYAHGEKAMEALKEKAGTGQPFYVMGELIAKGAGISASKFDPASYTGKVTKIGKEGVSETGPWAVVTMDVKGKERPLKMLATGEEVERLKAAGDAEISVDVAWTARKHEDRWMTSAQTANGLKRNPAPEPDADLEPGM